MSDAIRKILQGVKTTTTPDDYFKRLRRGFRAAGLAYQRDGNTINFPNDDCHMVITLQPTITWQLNGGLVGGITKHVAGGDEATREARRQESEARASTPRERKVSEGKPRKHKDRAGRGTDIHADYIQQTRQAGGRGRLLEMVNYVLAEQHLGVSDQIRQYVWLTFDARRLYEQFSTDAEVLYHLRDRFAQRGIQPTQMCFMPMGDDVNFLWGFGPMDAQPHLIHTRKLVEQAGGNPDKIPEGLPETYPEPEDGADGETPYVQRRTLQVTQILPNSTIEI